MSEPVLQLTRAGVRCEAAADVFRRLSESFAATPLLRLPKFLDSQLAALVDARLDDAAFERRVDKGREIEETIEEPSLVGLFTLVLNDPRLFALVDRMTGCGPIGCFTGRIYRRRESRWEGDRYYPWHDDVSDDRMIGLSINLGRQPYEGGLLQMRDAVTRQPVAEVANVGHGDAVVFRVSAALEHQVTPVRGAVPRTVIAGWFRARPSFADLLVKAKADRPRVFGTAT